MAHYYDEDQDSQAREEEVRFTIRGRSYSLLAASGLFSKKKLDNATELLIKSADLSEDESVLDLGCGWGPVAVVLKDQFPHVSMMASDTNRRAVKFTCDNARRNNVDVNVIHSHLFEKIDEDGFDIILTNPPYVAGRKVCFSFIEESYRHLKPGGRLHLVARHSKGGKMLSKKMEERFGNVADLAKQGGFRVYQSIKK
ncbi:MAG: class I SAM-dependent methyltransferase [Candidatus Woesearchaeota archaeon]